MIDIKKFLKGKAKEWKKESAEAKKYRDELKKKVQVAQRKAFAEESVKKASEQAKRRARAVYSPKAQQRYYNTSLSPVMRQLVFGTPAPKQVVHKVLKKKKKKRK